MATVPSCSGCTLFIPGHTVHFIQALHSAKDPRRPRTGMIVDIRTGVVEVDFDDDRVRYRNHETRRLRALVTVCGNRVTVDEGWSILRLHKEGGAYCFSVTREEQPWRRCRFDGLVGTDPESLRRHSQTHGGFLVPGRAVLEHLKADRRRQNGEADQGGASAAEDGR